MIDYDSVDCTPQQYHAGLDKLWDALGLTKPQEEDVFTLAGRKIKRLRAIVDKRSRRITKGDDMKSAHGSDIPNECGVSDEAQIAAYHHVDEMVKDANGFIGPAPWWHGWAVRKAFCAGAAWADAKEDLDD